MYQEKVKDIREKNKRYNIPVIYYWWFKESCFEELFKQLKGVTEDGEIKKKEIEGEFYGLLYIGKGKSAYDRLIGYHILDVSNYHFNKEQGIENRFLSSLRQTLCGLLGVPMFGNQQKINDFMDENCVVEWREVSLDKLETEEKEEIQKHYLPLNDKGSCIEEKYGAMIRNYKKEQRK